MIHKDKLKLFMKLNGAKSADGKLLDFSSNNKNGTLTGIEAYTETVNGKKMLACNGSTYVTVDNSGTTLAQSNTHTYVMRVKLQGMSLSGYLTIFSKGGATTTASCIDINNATMRFFGYNTAGTPRIISYNYLSNGYFGREEILTLVQDTNILKAYINKTLVGTIDAAGQNWATTTSNISIGARVSGTPSDVPIGDFMLFDNVAFSQTEVEQIVDELNNPAEFSPKIVLNEVSGVYEPLHEEDGLVFYTTDGIRDLSGKNTITNTNTIVGKGVVLSNGSMTWQTLTPTSYIYVWTGADGIKKHYAYDGTNTYINGILTGSQALTITATGFTGATGTLDYIKIYNSNLTAEQIKQSYEKSVRYW